MEPRQLLDADPVVIGVTYLESDLGQDTTPDYFEVTFAGGSGTTQLTQFVINGDQDFSGTLTDGDMFFDIDSSSPGTGGYHPFQFHAAGSRGVLASDILGFHVSSDGLRLTVDVKNFEAGDKLAFTIDVDEVEGLRVDKIASGVEFEGSLFNATFVDPHYNFNRQDIAIQTPLAGGIIQRQVQGVFYDEYDNLLAEGENVSNGILDLVRDNQQGQANRSAAAIDAYSLEPKPISISGHVYHDENLNCLQDVGEQGIDGVVINLQQFNERRGSYETVATTQTDHTGYYEFGADLGLMPGRFRLVETQPDGYLDVAASAGTVNGQQVGVVQTDRDGNENILAEIDIPLGGNVAENYDFKEVLPATLQGNVYHDRNNDGIKGPGEEGIANVLIRVTRLGPKAGTTAVDPFAATEPIFVRTDANGHYEVTGLPPGIYEVLEINNYPAGANPLVDFVDGKDTLGTVGSRSTGTQSNDRFSQIELCAGDHGVEFNFGELKPTSISGYVSIATPQGECLDPSDPNHTPLPGVEIQLFDINGNLVATTLTDSAGRYEFGNLAPGVYSVVEVQPEGYLDGAESLGNVNGVITGLSPTNDRFVAIDLQSGQSGTMYNFCEHLPASVKGFVWHDANDNGNRDAGEGGIAGTTIQLYDASGNLVAETTTDAEGRYCFDDLYAGQYKIVEVQPAGYVDGKESLGTVAGAHVGTAENDQFCYVDLLEGEQGVNYNFGEIKLGSIEGTVHADANGNCIFEPGQGDRPLPGVTLELLDARGQVIASTVTDQNGDYAFTGLRPGTYSVREVTPQGYLDGGESVGTVDGVKTGTFEDDLLKGIVIGSGQSAIHYDFCEHIPAEINGTVWFDVNNDGVLADTEARISGVTIELYDASGNLVASTLTDINGRYRFDNLIAGVYSVKEIQPTGYVDGKDRLGSVNGTRVGSKQNDQFVNINLKGGQVGDHYDFGEIRLASIEGFVHTDPNGDCYFTWAAGDRPIQGVKLQLLDANGVVINETTTDARGHYEFDKLLPGTYSIRQIQPGTYFTAGQRTGSGTGNDSADNMISDIQVVSGQNLVNYNFCEMKAAEIHGRVWEDGPPFENEQGVVPSNYRELRDGVFTQGIDTPIANVRLELWYYIDPDSGEIAPRPVTLSEVMGQYYSHMNTNNPNASVWVESGADGQYWFRGLQAGNFIVVEVQPDGYTDANNAVGTTTGFTYNSELSAALAPQTLLNTFSGQQMLDTVINIRVNAGQSSLHNNFSEVRAVETAPDVPFAPASPVPSVNPLQPAPPLRPGIALAGAQSVDSPTIVYGGRTFAVEVLNPGLPYTWHLSVVNGGQPRGGDIDVDQTQWLQAGYLSQTDWNRFEMQAGDWTFTTTTKDGVINLRTDEMSFGMIDGIPLAGDFDGDGEDEVVVYKDGYWLIDVNGNGRWDIDDLMARLGNEEDRPVVGDWDGDGKDDIGIYGPIWEGDQQAIDSEPGIPDAANLLNSRPKNIPPQVLDAADGGRAMRLTSFGSSRIDVIDHVFGYGEAEDIPIAGDWNGDSIRSIGMFRGGIWRIDSNGDGRFDSADAEFQFGAAGDIPLVGDFNGDGVDEIAVYRDGTWIIDINGNQQQDATDKVFELGGRGDLPVVGDWDGDGVDEPAIYSSQAIHTTFESS